ncbi:hypothetical protein M0J30_000248 [Klebsiella oxytoca]|uniref:Uncharacterized protein n=1 Tax=Klebsiella oxytoca TaxID=571 RepID=A0A6N3GT42_KLEOX|nr:hypothetical protein [Klebsiella oxytoca]AVL81540.1 hypothetical protein CEQ13_15780 [Klebsiella oxytoca]EKX5080555.1 hypothetical protein [Klebsiella oxytoca]EKX5093207.1 hypothetical protein [Klebsiella oxytoca]ELQ8986310.1 hypothetical protein [Klebsiella oxytoca]STR23787.1 Uncharacterised protein [Klebsiella oxytoca]
MFLEHNTSFNNSETLQMSPDGKDLSHIASEITSGRKMDENGEGYSVTASQVVSPEAALDAPVRATGPQTAENP